MTASIENSSLTQPHRLLFDKLSLFFLLLHLIFFSLNWYNYPTELDTPFHLLMGKMFADHGRIVLWDSYSFAPMGRPNLYPPLEHIVIWLMRSLTGMLYMDIGRTIVIFQLVAGLFFFWFVLRKLFDSRTAFYSLIFFTSCTDCWWWQTAVAPAGLIVALFWPAIYFYHKKSVLIPTLLLTICLYLNYGLTFTLILTMLLATLSRGSFLKEYWKNFLIILAASVLLFSPWIYHISLYKDFFVGAVDAKKINALELFSKEIYFEEILLNLNLFMWLLAIPGLVLCFKKSRRDFQYALLLGGFVSYFIFIFLFNGTRFNAHSPIVVSVLAGLGCGRYWDNIQKIGDERRQFLFKKFLAAIVFFTVFFEVHFLTPGLIKLNHDNIEYMGMETRDVFFRKTPLLNEIISVFAGMPLEGKHTVRIQRFFTYPSTIKLLKYIDKNIAKSEIIHIDNGALANLITLATDRKTDWGMYWEVVTPEMMRQIYVRRHWGYYISPMENLVNLLPPDCLEEKKYPVLLEKIGVYNIGYLPHQGLEKH